MDTIKIISFCAITAIFISLSQVREKRMVKKQRSETVAKDSTLKK